MCLKSCSRVTRPNFNHLLDSTSFIHFIQSKFYHCYKIYGGGRMYEVDKIRLFSSDIDDDDFIECFYMFCLMFCFVWSLFWPVAQSVFIQYVAFTKHFLYH